MSSARTLSLLFGIGMGTLAAGCGPATPEPAGPAKGTPVVTAAPTSAPAACAEGKGECDGNAATACETDLTSNVQHCGACGSACGSGQSCVGGACRAGQSISASGAAACAVVSGNVLCWGDNSYNLIARGAKGPVTRPVKINGVTNATLVRAGSRVGCAVTTEGKVACFHEGEARELPLISDVTDIALQDSTVLLVHKDGKLGAVDVGDNARELRPVELPSGIKDVVQITAAGYQACALLKSGEVSCWGDPAYTGQGKDVSNLDWSVREEMGKKASRAKDLKDAVQISMSGTHACAVRKTKQVMCWGSNWSGELGDGSDEHRYAPVPVQLLDDAVEVVAGHHHTCARRSGGKVVCWGEGGAGQLGSGMRGARGMVEVQGLTDATALTAAEEMSCAARANGDFACWGSASRGRLGDGTVSDDPTPHKVGKLTGVTGLALGDRFSCALDGTKHVQCWGTPSYTDSDLATRSFEPSLMPVQDVEAITMRDTYLCALDKAGDVSCETGLKFPKGATKQKLGKVKYARTGLSFGVALSPTGQVILWQRDWGKPGEVLKTNLSGLSDVVSVAMDSSSVCGVKKSGKVGCVGYHYRIFEKKDAVKPTGMVEVPETTDAVSIVGDGSDYCFVRKNGEAACFSAYRIPQAKDPKMVAAMAEAAKKENRTPEKEKPLPIEVRPIKGLTDVTSLATGGGAKCALLKSGAVSCWGSGTSGQLGNGEYSYSWDPVPVTGLTDAALIALGSGQACAAKKSGEVVCWGLNNADQAGHSQPAYAFAPVAVAMPKN